jgi:gliding motility-associated-like protein
MVLTIVQTPIANAGADVYMKEGDVGNLNGSGGSVYNWSPSTYLNDATVSSPSFPATQTITYTLTVSAPSNPLCFTTADVTVFVVKPVKVPNVITVNGDGSNDDWEIENIEGYPNVIIEIYNRWGNLVWKTEGYPKNWDGTNFRNGQVLPDGTYFYIINLQSQIYNEPLTGWVQIIK